jgi:hypothetical protein
MRTTRAIATAGFIADRGSIVRSNGGRQIDWPNVDVSFVNPRTGFKELPAGIPVGELLGVGKLSPRRATTNPATGLLETPAFEANSADALSGYGYIRGGAVYETLLPTATGTPRVLPQAVKDELNAAGASTGFLFLRYEDAR